SLHLPRPERRRRVELFPVANRPRGRDRYAGHRLKAGGKIATRKSASRKGAVGLKVRALGSAIDPIVPPMQHGTTPSIAAHMPDPRPSGPRSFLWLTLGCIGVVYGDIGTSPLYAMRESVLAATSGGKTGVDAAILGILSLIVWALILVVTVKYVLI